MGIEATGRQSRQIRNLELVTDVGCLVVGSDPFEPALCCTAGTTLLYGAGTPKKAKNRLDTIYLSREEGLKNEMLYLDRYIISTKRSLLFVCFSATIFRLTFFLSHPTFFLLCPLQTLSIFFRIANC